MVSVVSPKVFRCWMGQSWAPSAQHSQIRVLTMDGDGLAFSTSWRRVLYSWSWDGDGQEGAQSWLHKGTTVHAYDDAWLLPKRRGSSEPLCCAVFHVVSCSMLPAWFLALSMGFGIWPG